MLNDNQTTQVFSSKEFIKINNDGLNQFAKDIIKTGPSDFKPEVGSLTKVAYSVIKGRIIRKELFKSTSILLQRFLNYELMWERIPDSIKNICEAENNDFVWMRYDIERVNCLFNRAINLLQNSEFRSLLKSNSNIVGDKNNRLNELLGELKLFKQKTVFSIEHKGLFDQFVKMKAGLYYEENASKMIEKFNTNSMDGALGLNPKKDG